MFVELCERAERLVRLLEGGPNSLRSEVEGIKYCKRFVIGTENLR